MSVLGRGDVHWALDKGQGERGKVQGTTDKGERHGQWARDKGQGAKLKGQWQRLTELGNEQGSVGEGNVPRLED